MRDAEFRGEIKLASDRREGRNAYSKQWGDVNAAVVLSLIAINT